MIAAPVVFGRLHAVPVVASYLALSPALSPAVCRSAWCARATASIDHAVTLQPQSLA